MRQSRTANLIAMGALGGFMMAGSLTASMVHGGIGPKEGVIKRSDCGLRFERRKHSLFSKQVVVMLRETMSFIPNRLTQLQPRVVSAEPNRLAVMRKVKQFVSLGKPDHHGRLGGTMLKNFHRGGELPGTSINQKHVGQ